MAAVGNDNQLQVLQRLNTDYGYYVNMVNTAQPMIASLKEATNTLPVNEKRLYLYFQLMTWINLLHGMCKLALRTHIDQITALDRNANLVDLEPKLDQIKDDLMVMIEALRSP